MATELVERSQEALREAYKSGLYLETTTITTWKKKKKEREIYIVYILYVNRPFAHDS